MANTTLVGLLRCDYNRIDTIRVIDLIQGLLADEPLWEADELSYKLYCKDIRKYHFPDYDEEQLLMSQASKGDDQAINKLFLSHLGLVIHVARKYQNRGLPLNDLISEGNIGLYNATQKIDPNWIFRFGTYAVWYIRAAIKNAIARDGKVVHYPLSVSGRSWRIQKFISSFNLQNGRSPSEEDIAQLLDMPQDRIEDILAYSNSIVSIDLYQELFYDYDQLLSESANVYEYSDDYLDAQSLSIELDDALDRLTEREKWILKIYFGIGCKEKDIEQIAQMFDLTRERVRQIKEKAIRKLKGQRFRNLRQFLG